MGALYLALLHPPICKGLKIVSWFRIMDYEGPKNIYSKKRKEKKEILYTTITSVGKEKMMNW